MSTEAVPVSPPLAPVPSGQDQGVFYASLAGRLEAQDQGSTVTIWSDPEPEVSALAAPVRARVRYAPLGAVGADGTTPVTEASLVVQTWLWDYADLRAGGAPGAVPAVLVLGGVDEAECVAAATAHVTNDPAYADLDATERTTLLTDYESGTAALLVPAGAGLGLGAIDGGHASGYRRVTLSAWNGEGDPIETTALIDLLSSRGGPALSQHPLVEALRGPLHPAVVPVEGGIRVRHRGAGLSTATVITIGGAALADLWADAAGTTLYGTAPPGAPGPADLIVDGTVHAAAVDYTEDAVAATGAVMQAQLAMLEELELVGQELVAAGGLTDELSGQLTSELAGWEHESGHLITERLDALGLAATPSEVGATIDGFGDALAAAYEAALSVLRTAP